MNISQIFITFHLLSICQPFNFQYSSEKSVSQWKANFGEMIYGLFVVVVKAM